PLHLGPWLLLRRARLLREGRVDRRSGGSGERGRDRPGVVLELVAPDNRLVAALPGADERSPHRPWAGPPARAPSRAHDGPRPPRDDPRPGWSRASAGDAGNVPSGRAGGKGRAPAVRRQLLASLLRRGRAHERRRLEDAPDCELH